MLHSQQWHHEPGLCVDDMHDNHTAYHQRLILIRRYCWMKQPGPTLHDHVHETGSTDVLLHKGGWRVSVSPTLVESNLTAAGPC